MRCEDEVKICDTQEKRMQETELRQKAQQCQSWKVRSDSRSWVCAVVLLHLPLLCSSQSPLFIPGCGYRCPILIVRGLCCGQEGQTYSFPVMEHAFILFVSKLEALFRGSFFFKDLFVQIFSFTVSVGNSVSASCIKIIFN